MKKKIISIFLMLALILPCVSSASAFEITSIKAGNFGINEDVTITYTTNETVKKHEFNLHYDKYPNAFTNGTSRVKANGKKYTMSFKSGELTEGVKNACIRVTNKKGETDIKNVKLIILKEKETTEDTPEEDEEVPETKEELKVISITGGTFSVNDTVTITYTTNKDIDKHEFNLHYDTMPNAFSSGNNRVTVKGNTYTMTFKVGELIEGTKNAAIKLTDKDGNVVIKEVKLIITKEEDITTPNESEEDSTPSNPSSSALKDWDAFNNTYGNYVAYLPSQVGVNGSRIRLTAAKKTVTVTPKGGTGTVTTKNYVSGAMVSKKAYKYGTYTFKFKLSANDIYLWPMIWTLPDDVNMARPEFDLLESWGSYTGNSIIQTYHAYDSNGNSLINYQQAQTKTDLTKEHELKFVWTEDNVAKMYVDGVLKLTIKDYMVNYKTGEVDYQVWFLNLGLGTYNGIAPNGTGWFEITDYKFEPVYSKERTRQHYWQGNFTDGTLPSGTLND